jgi:hypothetical protein
VVDTTGTTRKKVWQTASVAALLGRPFPPSMSISALRFRRNVGASARISALCRASAARNSPAPADQIPLTRNKFAALSGALIIDPVINQGFCAISVAPGIPFRR